jgi:hypothetical protein
VQAWSEIRKEMVDSTTFEPGILNQVGQQPSLHWTSFRDGSANSASLDWLRFLEDQWLRTRVGPPFDN